MAYIDLLAPFIDQSIPLYGLQPTPLGHSYITNMEGLAERMVRAIRNVQPLGPYRIAGWCFGGMLAYEIATQLLGRDQSVEFLGLFDTYHPEWYLAQRIKTSSDMKQNVEANFLLGSVRHELTTERRDLRPTTELETIAKKLGLDALIERCRELSLIPRSLVGLGNLDIKQVLVRRRSMAIALGTYRPKDVPIVVNLFSTLCGNAAAPMRGWDVGLPLAQIRVHPVSGNDDTIMKFPHIESLGSRVTQILQNQ